MRKEELRWEMGRALSEKMAEGFDVKRLYPLFFFHENSIEDASMLYLDEAGCRYYGRSLEEIQAMGPEFLLESMHPADIERSVLGLEKFRERADEQETYSYFQRVKTMSDADYLLYLTCVRLDLERGRYCCVTCPISQSEELSSRVLRDLDCYTYIQRHMKTFKSLSAREVEVITWVCTGMSAVEIGKCLYLSHHTVEKHKKNIFLKTGFENNQELMEFAHNFNIDSFCD